MRTQPGFDIGPHILQLFQSWNVTRAALLTAKDKTSAACR
jgi:hypothetical protein